MIEGLTRGSVMNALTNRVFALTSHAARIVAGFKALAGLLAVAVADAGDVRLRFQGDGRTR